MEIIIRREPATLLLSGRFEWSGMGFGEENTLKAVTFSLCELLNKTF